MLSEIQLVVKHTFLEVVFRLGEEATNGSRLRASSDPGRSSGNVQFDASAQGAKASSIDRDADESTFPAQRRKERSKPVQTVARTSADGACVEGDDEEGELWNIFWPPAAECCSVNAIKRGYSMDTTAWNSVQSRSSSNATLASERTAEDGGLARSSGASVAPCQNHPIQPSSCGADLTKTQRRRQRRIRRVAASVETQVASQTNIEAIVEQPTTVILQNMPSGYSRKDLLAMVDGAGFAGKYDFVYMPVDFRRRGCYGFAFLNFSSPADAAIFKDTFEGFCDWSVPTKKVCSARWSNPTQGWQANVARYRNSPVMHPHVPDEYKPIVFLNGQSSEFPPPTKIVRAPRVRDGTFSVWMDEKAPQRSSARSSDHDHREDLVFECTNRVAV
eukprot:CAMPEP_0194495818 /NCGR_PEP_ID=MMETSP0253-20130528/13289_1 /TAXON_ID=2966 /ORGANISM="Noctiluca scintillans" /LENGTH=388 /DNA_ID=CAMNT_0039337137 /DNA_START=39 /DNA_END=1205 /DNA_ORIENTATION=+